MRKPVVVEAAQEFATKTFPIVAEIICLIASPLIVLGYWFNAAIGDWKQIKDRKLFSNTP